MLYKHRAIMYDLGLSVANAWGSIAFSMHLCIALSQENLLSLYAPEYSWDDMIAVMTLVGKDSFYVGSELPKSPENYLKKLCLQMGMTAVAFSNSKDKRLPRHEKSISKGRARLIKDDCAPVSDMFFNRYVRNTGQVDWTPDHVDRVLSRSLHFEDASEDDGIFVLTQTRDPQIRRERKRELAFEASSKKATAARMSPERLIRSLALVLQMESLTMAFPYLTLHRAARDVLHEVREACGPLLAESYGPAYSFREDNLPAVVTCIFTSLVEGDDRLFVRAGEVVNDQ